MKESKMKNEKDELAVLIAKFNNDNEYRRNITNKENSWIVAGKRPDSQTPENKLIMDVIMNMYQSEIKLF